eukprot:scaffold1149_cov236-Pinguiococcus_pyrenoidosus.AAC.10
MTGTISPGGMTPFMFCRSILCTHLERIEGITSHIRQVDHIAIPHVPHAIQRLALAVAAIREQGVPLAADRDVLLGGGPQVLVHLLANSVHGFGDCIGIELGAHAPEHGVQDAVLQGELRLLRARRESVHRLSVNRVGDSLNRRQRELDRPDTDVVVLRSHGHVSRAGEDDRILQLVLSPVHHVLSQRREEHARELIAKGPHQDLLISLYGEIAILEELGGESAQGLGKIDAGLRRTASKQLTEVHAPEGLEKRPCRQRVHAGVPQLPLLFLRVASHNHVDVALALHASVRLALPGLLALLRRRLRPAVVHVEEGRRIPRPRQEHALCGWAELCDHDRSVRAVDGPEGQQELAEVLRGVDRGGLDPDLRDAIGVHRHRDSLPIDPPQLLRAHAKLPLDLRKVLPKVAAVALEEVLAADLVRILSPGPTLHRRLLHASALRRNDRAEPKDLPVQDRPPDVGVLGQDDLVHLIGRDARPPAPVVLLVHDGGQRRLQPLAIAVAVEAVAAQEPSRVGIASRRLGPERPRDPFADAGGGSQAQLPLSILQALQQVLMEEGADVSSAAPPPRVHLAVRVHEALHGRLHVQKPPLRSGLEEGEQLQLPNGASSVRPTELLPRQDLRNT